MLLIRVRQTFLAELEQIAGEIRDLPTLEVDRRDRLAVEFRARVMKSLRHSIVIQPGFSESREAGLADGARLVVGNGAEPGRPGRPIGSAKSVAPRLTELRVARGWSQRTLADRSGLTASTLGALERGDVAPLAHHLAALAVAFDTTEPEIARLFDASLSAEIAV